MEQTPHNTLDGPTENPGFRIDAKTLWPEICPSCGYSWRGLGEPRCPECGEHVESGEIVLVGVSLTDKSTLSGRNLFQDLLLTFLAMVLAAGWTFYFEKASAGMLLVFGALLLTMLALVVIYARLRRHWGIPKGGLRLSAGGFRIGAGDTKGVQRHWNASSIISIRRKRDTMILEYFRICYGVRLSRRFGLAVHCATSVQQGLLERLRLWAKSQVICRD